MRGVYKRKEPPEAGLCPPLEQPPAEQGTPIPNVTPCKKTGWNKGNRCSMYGGEKVYVGVRVRMPVRDLLKNIRVPKGVEPDDFNERGSKKGSGNMKRARARSRNKPTRGQCPVKSLEELATILEVLEEDLRTGCTSLSQNPSPSDFTAYPNQSPTDVGGGDRYEEIIPSPESYTIYSPSTSEYDAAWARSDCMFFDLQPSGVSDRQLYGDKEDDWFKLKNNWDPNSSAFFWTQLQKEEEWWKAVSDAELLTTDEHGRTLLHRAVCVGKRAKVYAIAQRMALIKSLDLKDSDGMTALLYAAKRNQHLIVADLIRLGANVNEKNNLGKTCLHLSAENGYIRVLEVLKQGMMDGMYIDIEATDNSGMTVLQCASVALKSSMSEVACSMSRHSRLHTLRQEHLMETLKCVLQMDSYLHTAARQSASGELEYGAHGWLHSQQICPAGHFVNPTVMF
ncbi:NF-kappa-B inhibitor zeta [Fundulus heteroclitus]|uniref:NF-kappa-B inhibitor zeta n=1 Tax=Fundulus heteroclitus TaxID=8078 RepID=UPI00165B7B21|nr:NF-kappa-B inhibitor zeta [Fundulus heteroclitus]